METVKYHTTENRSLGYTADFKVFIKSHPEVLKKFFHLIKKLDLLDDEALNAGEVYTEGDIEATVIKAYRWNPEEEHHFYFKLNIDDHCFFIKSEGVPHRGKGYEEIKNTNSVQEKLETIPWVDVVDFQLGYQDKNGRSFFVSKWENLPILHDYLKSLREDIKFSDDSESQEEKIVQLTNRVKILQSLLPEFHDITSYNMFYDETNDKLILFDLFDTSQSLY